MVQHIDSLKKLKTCDYHLQVLFGEIVKFYDCEVVYGYRSPEEQFLLFQKGRALVNGEWKVYNKNNVVTNCDGYQRLSAHNYSPSRAVDVAPLINGIITYNTVQFYHFCGFVKGVATAINLYPRIIGGHDWDGNNNLNYHIFNDLLHWEIKE